MPQEWWFQKVQEGGAISAVLLLGALIWMAIDRKRLLDALDAKDVLIKTKDDQLLNLSERTMVVLTRIETFLFHGGRPQ